MCWHLAVDAIKEEGKHFVGCALNLVLNGLTSQVHRLEHHVAVFHMDGSRVTLVEQS